MRMLFAVGLVALLAVTAGASQDEWSWPPSDEVAALVETNLDRHFEGDELRTYLADADEQHRGALEFLMAWMPTSDLGSLPADLLISNVELALDTWNDAGWKDEIDPYLFHVYVLPHRASQEPVQNWRARLNELGAARVQGMTMTEAALEIGRLTREWATYKASSRRDQGPLTTMERGIGRCGEEMILTICALRSVGIPVRSCSAPWWTTGNSNHAWVEVYVGRDEGWHYMESCNATACLDRTWFSQTVKRAGVVLSVGFGEAPVPAEYEPMLHRQADGATILNSTDVYTTAGTLYLAPPPGYTPAATEDDDTPEANIHIYNYSAPVVLIHQPFESEVMLGPGDYVVTTGIDGEPWSALAHITAGERTVLELEPGMDIFDEPIWLRYPLHPESEGGSCDTDENDPTWLRHQRDLARRDLERCKKSAFTPPWIDFLVGRDDATQLREKMTEAGAVQAEWTGTVLAMDGEIRTTAIELVKQMDVKDFYEMDTENLELTLREILRVRALAPDVPDTVWNEFVLSPRLYFQEGTFAWWTELPWLGDDESVAPQAGAILSLFRERVEKVDRLRFGHVATPSTTWRSGYAESPGARACLVGLLRRHGIPARAELGVDYVEAWSEGDWTRFEPFEDEESDAAESEGELGAAAYLSVSYFDQGVPIENVETWIHTRLMRFEDGRFRTWYLGQLSEGDGIVEWSLPEGEYWLFGGLRNPRGEPRFVSKSFEIAALDSLYFEMDIGIPLSEWEPEDLVQQEWDIEKSISITIDGQEHSIDELAPTELRLIVLTLSGHEASVGHMTHLQSTDWTAHGMTLVPLQVSGLEGHPAEDGAMTISTEAAEDVFGISSPESQIPLTVLLTEDGETLIWLKGMRKDMSMQIERMLSNWRR